LIPAVQKQQWSDHGLPSYLLFTPGVCPYSSHHFSEANSMPEHTKLCQEEAEAEPPALCQAKGPV